MVWRKRIIMFSVATRCIHSGSEAKKTAKSAEGRFWENIYYVVNTHTKLLLVNQHTKLDPQESDSCLFSRFS